MSSPPVITIVTPAYNAESFLGAMLDSALAQTLADWECIVVDDGSTDGTAEVARQYAAADPRIRLLQQKNAGAPVARNRGYREAHPLSRYVIFMDSDDVWLPTALQTLQEALEPFPDAVGAHGLADHIDAQGNLVYPGAMAEFGRERLFFDGKKIANLDISAPTSFTTLITHSKAYPPGLVLVRRSFYDKTSGFDEELVSCQDWDMWLRLICFGDMRFVNELVILYRRHSNNMTNNTKREHAAVRYVFHKAFYSPENSEEQKQTLRGSYRAWQLYRIGEKRQFAAKMLKQRHWRPAAFLPVHIAVHLFRYLRGYPTRNG